MALTWAGLVDRCNEFSVEVGRKIAGAWFKSRSQSILLLLGATVVPANFQGLPADFWCAPVVPAKFAGVADVPANVPVVSVVPANVPVVPANVPVVPLVPANCAHCAR